MPMFPRIATRLLASRLPPETLLGLMDVQLPRPFLTEGSTLPPITMELSGSGLLPQAMSGSGDPTASRVCVDIHGSGYHHQRQKEALDLG